MVRRRPDGSYGVGADAACPTAGVTAVRILAGDGNDEFGIAGVMPVAIDLGPGDDKVKSGQGEEAGFGPEVAPPAMTIGGGDGNDTIDVTSRAATLSGDAGADKITATVLARDASGEVRVDGGDGDDQLVILGESAAADVIGGAGDDNIFTAESGGNRVDCGAGADRTDPDFDDQLGAGCAPHLGGLKVKGRVAHYDKRSNRLRFTDGRLTRAATVKFTVYRAANDRRREAIASGTLTLKAGKLRGALRVTGGGAARLRKTPRISVYVKTVVTEKGSRDRETNFFAATLR
jgi:hypothetical protein